MTSITVGAPIIEQMLEGAILAGYDAANVLRDHDIPPQILHSPQLRVPIVRYAKLANGIIQLMEDEGRGMLVRPMKIGTMKAISRACFSATSMEQSLSVWTEASNLMPHPIAYDLETNDGAISLVMEYEKHPQVAGNTVASTQLVAAHRFHCWLAKEFIPVTKVEFCNPEPRHAFEYHFAFYGAPVLFNQQRNAITFDRKSLNLGVNQERVELEQWLERPLSQLLTQPRFPASNSVKIRHLIEKNLREAGAAMMLEEVAECLELTPQTLRRHLKKDGMSFHEIKEDTRRDIAINLLSAGRLSIEEVAFRAGFSEASTFTRAFKKWTGLTPLAYKRMESQTP